MTTKRRPWEGATLEAARLSQRIDELVALATDIDKWPPETIARLRRLFGGQENTSMSSEPHQSTEEQKARRLARFKFARDRIREIVDRAPPLTTEQVEALRILLRPPSEPQPPPVPVKSREIRAATLAARIVRDWPPLTEDDRAVIREILLPVLAPHTERQEVQR